MPKYLRPKYTHDVYPGAQKWEEDSDRTNALESIFRELCALYGYGEVRTPVFESTDLFKRSIGDETDIVSKEMYTFNEPNTDRSVTLRPEGTAPSLRAYLENGMYAQGGTTKLYYVASIFRAERGHRGRYRQHEQLGVEALGSDDPALDLEVISMALTFFRNIGIKNLTLKINSVGSIASRAGYITALRAYVEPYLSEFGQDGQTRFVSNALRMLDTKNPRELEILRDAPKLTEYVSDDERTHFETLCGYLNATGIAYEIDPYLVRGFDYYTKTAFEIQSPDLGAQNALGGGGRYNSLVEQIGGSPTPGIGFGLGVERALIALQEIGAELPLPSGPVAQIITLGDAAKPAGVKLLAELRNAGIASNIEYGARSMKAQMRAANDSKARFALILGENEITEGVVQVKDMTTSEQRAVPMSEIVAVCSHV